MDRLPQVAIAGGRFPKAGGFPAIGISLLLVVLFLGGHAALVVSGLVPALDDGRLVNLFDADAYARALRLDRFWAEGWLGGPQEILLNAPDGMLLHWTRVVDVLGLSLAAVVRPFAGDQSPVFLAGMVMGPLLHLAAIPLILWGCKPFLSPLARALACLLFLVQPAATFNFATGTFDHHGLMALLALAIGILVARALHQERLGWAGAAGAASGLAVWVSPEGIILQVPVLAAFGLLWLRGDAQAIRSAFAFTLAHLCVVAVAVTIEGQWGNVDLYRVSQPHLALAGLTAAVAGLATLIRSRVIASGVGLIGLVGLWKLFPGLFADPQVNLDPVVRRTLIDAVGVEGPWSFETAEQWRDAVLGMGPAVPALLFSAWALSKRSAGRHLFTLLAVAAMLAYVLLGKARGLQYVACFVTLPWAECLVALMVRHRVMGMVAAAGHFILAGLITVTAVAATPVAACPTAAMARFIGRSPAPGPVILTDLFSGPEVAYRTGYGVLGSPYDQNVAGINDTARLLGESRPDAAFWRLMQARQVRAVLLCRHAPPEIPEGSLAARLLAGDPPAGLRSVALPPKLAAAFVFYEVTR